MCDTPNVNQALKDDTLNVNQALKDAGFFDPYDCETLKKFVQSKYDLKYLPSEFQGDCDNDDVKESRVTTTISKIGYHDWIKVVAFIHGRPDVLFLLNPYQ